MPTAPEKTNDTAPLPVNQFSRFMFHNCPVRGLAVQLHDVWQDIHSAHDYPEPVRQLLGQAMAAITMLTGNIKFTGAIKLQIHSRMPEADSKPEDTPIKSLMAQCTDQLGLRGLVHWEQESVTNESTMFLEKNQIALTLQHYNTGKNYQGLIDSSSNSLAQGLEEYHLQSEQLPTRIWLFVTEESACGIMLQKMPEAASELDLLKMQSKDDPVSNKATIEPFANEDAWERLQYLTETLKGEELSTLPITDVLHRLYHEEDCELLSTKPVTKFCPCKDENRVENMLRGLGKKELDETLEQEGVVKVNCEFCNIDFSYDSIDVEQLFNEDAVPGSPLTQ